MKEYEKTSCQVMERLIMRTIEEERHAKTMEERSRLHAACVAMICTLGVVGYAVRYIVDDVGVIEEVQVKKL